MCRCYGERFLIWLLLLVPFTLTAWGAVEREKREVRCPVYLDPAWQVEDKLCQTAGGKAYHCFEDDNGHVTGDGCYKPKVCGKGAHPVIEGEAIVCAFCSTGFQPVDQLNSAAYTSANCRGHSQQCLPEYGQSQCHDPTRENDRACTCNQTLGFSSSINSSECQCFTPNSPCSGCKFTGCPPERVRNDKGFCAPEITASTTLDPFASSERTTHPSGGEQDGFPGWAIAVIVIIILLVLAGLALLAVWRKRYRKAKKDSADGRKEPLMQSEEGNSTSQRNGNSVQYGRNEPLMPSEEGNSTSQRNGDSVQYIRHVQNLYITDHGNVSVNVNKTKGEAIFGGKNIMNQRCDKGSTSSTEGPESSPTVPPAGAAMSNGKLPSDPAEKDQTPQSQEPADTVSPEDRVAAERLSEGVPGATKSEEAPPLLPTAPNPPLDPSAPPASLPFDQGPIEEEGEGSDETDLKTPATTEEMRVKVPSSPSEETKMKRPASLEEEETELKGIAPAGDSGDTAQLENTDPKTPLLGNGKGDGSTRGKNRGLRDEDSKSRASGTQAEATDDAESDVAIRNKKQKYPILSF